MYYRQKTFKTTFRGKVLKEGERLEEKMQRILHNNEPITDGAPVIYTERKDGVIADYDPRADKWEAAIDATDVITKTGLAKREERLAKKNMEKEQKQENKDNEGKA